MNRKVSFQTRKDCNIIQEYNLPEVPNNRGLALSNVPRGVLDSALFSPQVFPRHFAWILELFTIQYVGCPLCENDELYDTWST